MHIQWFNDSLIGILTEGLFYNQRSMRGMYYITLVCSLLTAITVVQWFCDTLFGCGLTCLENYVNQQSKIRQSDWKCCV